MMIRTMHLKMKLLSVISSKSRLQYLLTLWYAKCLNNRHSQLTTSLTLKVREKRAFVKYLKLSWDNHSILLLTGISSNNNNTIILLSKLKILCQQQQQQHHHHHQHTILNQ
jgi:hypothetical protein